MLSKFFKIKKYITYKITIFLEFFSKKGQIDLYSEIGRWIYLLSSLNSTLVIVEIGTWNGKGSSSLISAGVIKSGVPNKSVIGLEINKQLALSARKNLAKYEFFKVIHGNIVEISEIDSVNLSNLEQKWIKEDLANIELAPNVLDQLPQEIHLLVLDGGEFTTYAEYQILRSRIRGFIVLDDTNTRKCRRILNEALEQGLVVFESPERNGVAVLYISG